MEATQLFTLEIQKSDGPLDSENSYRYSIKVKCLDGTHLVSDLPGRYSEHSEAVLVAQNLLKNCLTTVLDFLKEQPEEN